MADIPLVPTDYRRLVAKEPSISLRNRFAERNPSLNNDPVSVISRPGLSKFAEVGTGPIRKVFSQAGTFNDDLFVISGTFLHRVDRSTAVSSSIGQLSTNPLGSISMAATAPIGDTVPAYLFIAEGGVLWCYTEDGSAIGHLEASGAIADGDDVVIDGVYYTWTTGDVNAGTPDGTSGNPWLLAHHATNIVCLTNLYNAINLTGAAGTDYSTGVTEHPTVAGSALSPNDLYITAKEAGTIGNSIAVSETGANLSWSSGATLSGGGTPQLRQVQVPDDVGAISVATINSYVIVIPVQEENIKGRFYWIDPGEVFIDPLNFATAERSPDALHQVVVFGNMFWLLGQSTTEPWVTTGSIDAPMQRFQGILFDRGSWNGTAIQIKDSLFVIDEDGGWFQISDGLRRITQNRPDIEERTRAAIQTSSSYL